MKLLCKHANKVRKGDEDFFVCRKYKSYCYFDEPNLEDCIDSYGSEDIEDELYDDDNNTEDAI